MAPPNWVTSKQLEFLHSYVPIFIEHKEKETQSKFWPCLSKDWFSCWPELDRLIKDGKLPPQASAGDHDAPDDADATNTRYRLTIEERELYGEAIKTHTHISILYLNDYRTH